MTIEYGQDGFGFITDDTKAINSESIFLLTAQNTKYFNLLETKPLYITPDELIKKWHLEDLKVVGVTGTNGKTSTTAGIYSFLLDLGYGCALLGTRGFYANEKCLEAKKMTTPSIFEIINDMRLAKENGCDFFVMEVSSHAIVQKRIEGLKFALKIHTNVTSDHLDYHKTVEEYRAVKSQFFDDETPKLLNKDEIEFITYNPVNAQSYGLDNPATFKVQAFSLKNGITAGINHLGEEVTFSSPMVGLFNLYNLMAGIGAVSMLTSAPLSKICEVVENFGGVAGRMEVVSSNPLIIVDFAHTDDGMLKVFESMKDHDIVTVFGAGGDRDKLKRPLMGAVASRFAKKIYVTSDNPRSEEPEVIIKEILAGIKDQTHTRAMVDRAFAISEAMRELQSGEVLLILGKGDEDYQEIKGEKYHFDDREIVRKILEMSEKI